ncbi:MAG: acetyl-CoA hydrolase/transferase C-terminal domain-containing protein [Candidatus Korobacteraceae bacterium]|jgi:acyl-CoA hydrolase
MSWEIEYSRKLKTAEEALKTVQSGMRLWTHANSGCPTALLSVLAQRAPDVHDVEVCHLLSFTDFPTAEPQYAANFRHKSLFIGSNVRTAVAEGRADYVPIHLHEVERLMESGRFPIDVALIQVTLPDRHGFVSMGPCVEATLTAARCAKYVIAQVNSQVPRTCGNTQLHVSEIDAFVEISEPVAELRPHPSSETQRLIARNVASLIEDGSTIQVGLGGLPDAILTYLTDRKDLGVHTEVLSDGAIPLIESGVINGKFKTFHPNKIVVAIALGTRKLYEFIHENAVFEFLSNKYINDPFLIAQNDRMVAINAALQVDLTGQVCAESIGQQFYSGFGGQLDFIRGAARAKGGKPVIALPATAKNGTMSRIVPMLNPGAGVLTTRADVHYVATEFGIVDLFGKSVRERAELLISISHPSFRDELFDHCLRARWFQRNDTRNTQAQAVSVGGAV